MRSCFCSCSAERSEASARALRKGASAGAECAPAKTTPAAVQSSTGPVRRKRGAGQHDLGSNLRGARIGRPAFPQCGVCTMSLRRLAIQRVQGMVVASSPLSKLALGRGENTPSVLLSRGRSDPFRRLRHLPGSWCLSHRHDHRSLIVGGDFGRPSSLSGFGGRGENPTARGQFFDDSRAEWALLVKNRRIVDRAGGFAARLTKVRQAASLRKQSRRSTQACRRAALVDRRDTRRSTPCLNREFVRELPSVCRHAIIRSPPPASLLLAPTQPDPQIYRGAASV
jgi:hypothetical protein